MSPPVLAIVGPTAVGKTAVAVELCRRVSGEIVSVDSRQVYRGIPITSNAPTRQELEGVRCHLVATLDPGTRITAKWYQRRGAVKIAEIQERGHVPVVTAGTGLYLKALLEGLDLGGVAPDPESRARLTAMADDDLPTLVGRLRAIDADLASRIDIKNPRRVVRALELATIRQAPLPSHRRPGVTLPALPSIKAGLFAPRAELYAWIEARVDGMLTRGWEREVERLLTRGIDPSSQAFSGLGVLEMAAVVRGEMRHEEARRAIVKKTRNYAKRQLTWFRADPEVEWIDVTAQSRSDIVDRLVRMLATR